MDSAAHTLIAGLSSAVTSSALDGLDERTRAERLRSTTVQILALIDQYVGESIHATETSPEIQRRVRAVLSDHRPNPEYGDLPLARSETLRQGQSLILAFTLVRGSHDDIATIRGYAWRGGRFALSASAAGDFAGYSMFKAELASPVAGESWLLAWGQALTFNGKKVRCRVYAFDGGSFRTVWEPDDVFNATVTVTSDGFSVEHEPERRDRIKDVYRLTASGPVKVY